MKRNRYIYAVETEIRPLQSFALPSISRRYFSNRNNAEFFAYGVACELSGTGEDSPVYETTEGNMTGYRFSRMSDGKVGGHFGTVTVTRERVE